MRKICVLWVALLVGVQLVSVDMVAQEANVSEHVPNNVMALDTLGLEIFNIELDAVTVSAKSRKEYKRLKKSQKESLIAEFKQKLAEDFPQVENEYNVLSGYRLLQDTVVLTSGSMEGLFVELPKAAKDGKDSLAVVDAVYKEYVNAKLRANMQELDGKQEQIHKLLWGVTPTTSLKALEDVKGKWDYIPNGDGTSYVVFRGSQGFLGIVHVEWKINYLVDSKTLGLLNLTQNLDAKVSIPFGMGVKDENLETLNMLNVAYENFDSFKFRKGTFTLKRYVEFVENTLPHGASANIKSLRKPVVKVLDSELQVIGKKDKAMVFEASANAKIL